MISPATFAQRLHKAGRPMDLKRRIGTSSTFNSCTVRGRAVDFQPAEILGLIKSGDRKIRFAATDIPPSWPGPPKAGDFLDGSAIQGVEVLYDGAVVLGFKCWVR